MIIPYLERRGRSDLAVRLGEVLKSLSARKGKSVTDSERVAGVERRETAEAVR